MNCASVAVGLLAAAAALVGCERRPPPGGEEGRRLQLDWHRAESTPPRATPTGSGATSTLPQLGTPDDSLPFSPTGLKLVSIAWRTWIYTDTGPTRTRLGYLRAGGVVDARGPALHNDGCQGGWYRINPRGFVCLGKGATLDLNHPLAHQLKERPRRGEGFPYVYALSGTQPPDRYFRLPSLEQMDRVEQESTLHRAAAFRQRAEESGLAQRIGLTEELPPFLTPETSLEKPYGTKIHEKRVVSAGRASQSSGFALVDAFLWQGRAFGLTSELELVALDRTRVVLDGDYLGAVLAPGEKLAVAFHVKGVRTLFKRKNDGAFVTESEQRGRRAFKLTGVRADGMLETTDGVWVAQAGLRMLAPRDGFPSIATGDRRWLDISVKQQTLVAYVGQRPVFATLVSTGRGGLGPRGESNPDGERTVRGTFMIYDKSLTSTMDGDEDRADSYELLDVPFVQYFHRGFALHGAYWHDEFGKERSHGCINLSSRDAAWLFAWTDPQLPDGWHGVLNKERGTVVVVGF